MSNREVEIERTSLGIKYGEKEEFLIVSLNYQLGGVNWFTGRDEGRGFYIHVSPITEEKRDGHTMRGFTIGSGLKSMAQPAKAFSQKSLERIAKGLKEEGWFAEHIAKLKHEVLKQRAGEHQRSYDMGWESGGVDRREGKAHRDYGDGPWRRGYDDGHAGNDPHNYATEVPPIG